MDGEKKREVDLKHNHAKKGELEKIDGNECWSNRANKWWIQKNINLKESVKEHEKRKKEKSQIITLNYSIDSVKGNFCQINRNCKT